MKKALHSAQHSLIHSYHTTYNTRTLTHTHTHTHCMLLNAMLYNAKLVLFVSFRACISSVVANQIKHFLYN